MCFETSFEEAAQRKKIRYGDIVEQARLSHYRVKLITVEVGSRGIVNMEGFLELEHELNIHKREIINGCCKDSNSRVTKDLV